MDGEQFDFAMAFTQAPCEELTDIELPDIPDAEHLGGGPSGAPQNWHGARGADSPSGSQHGRMGTIETVTITIFTCDNCAFSMSWGGLLIGGLHSDDGIFTSHVSLYEIISSNSSASVSFSKQTSKRSIADSRSITNRIDDWPG